MYGEYGSLFGNDYDTQIQLFTKLEDLLKSVKVFGIEDILASFSFGDSIKISHDLDTESKAELLNKFWIPTLLFDSGYCYSFEPKQHGLDKIPVVTDRSLLEMKMSFNVSRYSL